MKPGDKIKAFCKIGLMRRPEWVVGTFVGREGDKVVVSIHNQTHSLESREVKEWKPLTFKNGVCKEAEEFQQQNWDDLKVVISRALEHFFPKTNPVFNDEEKTIHFDDDVVVGPGVIETESIVRFFERPCWTVTAYHTFSYSHLQPPDVDEINLGDSTTNIGITRILIDALWRIKSEPYWDNQTDWSEV